MPRGERLMRAVERLLMPWFDRAKAEQAEVHSEEIRQRSIAARIEAERIRKIYLERLIGTRRGR